MLEQLLNLIRQRTPYEGRHRRTDPPRQRRADTRTTTETPSGPTGVSS